MRLLLFSALCLRSAGGYRLGFASQSWVRLFCLFTAAFIWWSGVLGVFLAVLRGRSPSSNPLRACGRDRAIPLSLHCCVLQFNNYVDHWGFVSSRFRPTWKRITHAETGASGSAFGARAQGRSGQCALGLAGGVSCQAVATRPRPLR